ncbi:DUF3500 domain-containing protein [Agromyces archimandritae]|uniref:DUF3500 domain-containing protein n=1 Tax=Agromyces archimandritae TaxID=2781962 RepID=A0A975INC8_9MICO|nr:DUF3500 domain-containing protein [Agromyces archimandritae]QTX04430.1 DUF3500 domain-containing protein [Agromyces archimandritae]
MSAHGEDIDGFFTTARTAGRSEAVAQAAGSFRDYLYDLDDPTLAPYRGMGYEEFTADRYTAPFLRELLETWEGLYREPFVGITTGGEPEPGRYRLPDEPFGDDAEAIAAAGRLLDALSPAGRARISYPVDAPEWRGWSNPEFVFFRTGIRLEDEDEPAVDAVHALMRATLSPEGYDRVREAMRLNGYLGELTRLPTVMNERSYWFAIFGEPGEGPWGWQLFGHHAAVNFVSVGGRHVVAPVFLGGEPAVAEGREPLFAARERLAIELAESLTGAQRAAAVVYDSVLDPAMPEGRLHPADERHVAGAFRDNRVVPYEGILASELDAHQQELLRAIVEDFLLLLAEPQRAATLAEVEATLAETRFSWYGATDGSEPCYFRIHGPVILAELDHHAGVWLANRLPARFHVHTTLRMPNGNDYGKAYLAEWMRRHAGS